MQVREIEARGVEKHRVGYDGAVILAARLPRAKVSGVWFGPKRSKLVFC
jgi:hypothetical protein